MGTSVNGKAGGGPGGSTGRRTIQNASEIDKQGNPFASLAGHMGAAFREAGKKPKKPTTPRRQPKPSLPEYDPQPTPSIAPKPTPAPTPAPTPTSAPKPTPPPKTNGTNGAGSA